MKKIFYALTTSLLFASTAQANVYQATNWMAPTHVLNSEAYGKFIEDVTEGTDNEINFELYSSGSLVPAQTTLSAIGDGVAQLGIVASSYTPSDLPLSGLINDLAFVAEDEMATAFAFTELTLTNQRMLDELKRHNTVPLGAYSTPTYVFLCMKEVSDLNSLKGLKVRTAGTAQNEWISYLDAIPVAVPMTEAYTGLERGSIDCILSDPTNLAAGYMFWEIAKDITMLEQGTSLGLTYVYNSDFWKDIGAENRKKIMDLTAKNLARTQIAYANTVNVGFEGAKERNINFIEPEADLTEKLAEFREKIVEDYPVRTDRERGVENSREIAEQFLALEEKWQGLLAEIDRTDEEQLSGLIADEIYNKLDPETFGL